MSQLRTEALALLKDGLSTHMEQRDSGAAKGDGYVSRRRAAYAAQIALNDGIDLGRTVLIGTPPEPHLEYPQGGDLNAPPWEVGVVPGQQLTGELVRFEGADGRLTAVVMRDEAGTETRTTCDSAVVGLGRTERDLLARMAPSSGVHAVGTASD